MTGASGAEMKGVCTEAGMYALRERRLHVTQEDFELAAAKVVVVVWWLCGVTGVAGDAEGQREKHVHPQVLHVMHAFSARDSMQTQRNGYQS